MDITKELAVTGRVKSWLDNPESRLPVSCTTFSVEDSMEGKDGIEDSWVFTSHGLRNAAGVALDLSKLRPTGTDNKKGLISSGPVSFAKFYSLLNQELRRGGQYKNGAITLFLDYDHPDCAEFLEMPPKDLPWAKKAVYIDDNVANHPILDLLAQKVNNGSVWLAKKQYDDNGNRLYSNVCLEILLAHRGTCLLSHVNLGQVLNFQDLPKIFAQGMTFLCELHSKTGVSETNYYLDSEQDRQVGLGVIGLANLLAMNGITYLEFVEDLEAVLDGKTDGNSLGAWLFRAYMEAARVARKYKMDRAFTIAPTASCSYNYTDAYGFTTAPEISPPLAREVDRDSETLGIQTYEYHPAIETAMQVGWDTQWRLLKAWQRLMDITGLSHSISANIWNSQFIDANWIINEFLPSPLKTTYYRITVDNRNLDKTVFIKPIEEDEEEEVIDGFCPISPDSDPQYCSACGG